MTGLLEKTRFNNNINTFFIFILQHNNNSKKIKKLDIYITLRYIISNFAIARCDISKCNAKSGLRVYVPMTETGFYILFCLQEEMHGYNITQKVKEMTEGQVEIGPGTMYGTLGKMEKDGLIEFVREEEKRKLYKITHLGQEILQLEIARIKRLYRNIEGK